MPSMATGHFFLMANSHDPHRPFYGNDKAEWYGELDPPAVPPSRTFAPEEVIVPGFFAAIYRMCVWK